MTKLRKFADLSWNERWVLCRAAWLLLAAEVCLRIFPFPLVLHWARSRRGQSRSAGIPNPERIAWLVEVAARHCWGHATCLRKSLVLCALLRERGWAARLVIGTTSPRQGFQAHAWVELNGKILGPQGGANYQELAAFGCPSSENQLA
ncbi:MAG: lasso peptide biosynthesis B2 protein [Acidobacteria bacterium]|nr:lasso peptide biosynthesis B2 protein [Acidobacteriota bacterium]